MSFCSAGNRTLDLQVVILMSYHCHTEPLIHVSRWEAAILRYLNLWKFRNFRHLWHFDWPECFRDLVANETSTRWSATFRYRQLLKPFSPRCFVYSDHAAVLPVLIARVLSTPVLVTSQEPLLFSMRNAHHLPNDRTIKRSNDSC